MSLPLQPPIAPNSKWLFIGDSITDANRDECGEATPWDPGAGQGKGYVGYLNALLLAAAPELRLRLINRGINGHTVHDLKARWQNDVIDLKPDWLSVMIGINDVWRHFDVPLRTEMHHSIEAYRETYTELLKKTRPLLKGLVLMTPFVLERNKEDDMRAMMDAHGAVVRELAGEFDAVFVDTQAAMDEFMQHYHPTSIAWDRIHPNPSGHMTLAMAVLRSFKVDLGATS